MRVGQADQAVFFYKKNHGDPICFILSEQAGRQTDTQVRGAVESRSGISLCGCARAPVVSCQKKQTRKRKPRGTGGGRRGGRRQAKEEHGGAHAHPASQPVTHTQRTQGKGKGVVLVSICCCGCPAPAPPPPQTQATRTLRYAGMNPSVPHAWQWHHPSPTFLPPPASRPPGPGGERD
jgi:hypothetical protein